MCLSSIPLAGGRIDAITLTSAVSVSVSVLAGFSVMFANSTNSCCKSRSCTAKRMYESISKSLISWLMSTPSVDECVSDIHRKAGGVGAQFFSIRFHAANCLACH